MLIRITACLWLFRVLTTICFVLQNGSQTYTIWVHAWKKNVKKNHSIISKIFQSLINVWSCTLFMYVYTIVINSFVILIQWVIDSNAAVQPFTHVSCPDIDSCAVGADLQVTQRNSTILTWVTAVCGKEQFCCGGACIHLHKCVCRHLQRQIDEPWG